MRRFWWLPALGGCLLVGCLVLSPGCSRAPSPWKDEPGSPRVVVTIAPLASFVRAVAGERAAVKCLCTTTGPHEYKANYSDSRLMKEADVVFAIGIQLDDAKCADTLHRMSGRGDKLPVIKLGDRLPAGMVRKMRPHKHDADAGGAPHSHGEYDPHVWLGLAEAGAIVDLIRNTLCDLDPKHAEEYKKNAVDYRAKLSELHEDARTRFGGKARKRIVSFHDAFEYFAEGVGLKIADVIELAPGVPPSQGHVVQLQKLCRDNPIGAITIEPQYDVGLAKQLQLALRGGTPKVEIDLVSIDPLETAEVAELRDEGADWYLSRMKQNVEKLDKVLK